MATLSSGLRVPLDVVSMILSRLDDTGPKFDIFCASLVCRSWYHAAFPTKFRNITIENVRQLSDLTTRLEVDNDKGLIRLSSCLRALFVDIHSDDPHTHQELYLTVLSRFQLVIKQLVNLEELSWTYYCEETSVSAGIFGAFRDFCPKLRRVSIDKSQSGVPEFLKVDDLRRDVFTFKSLDNLAISWHDAIEGLFDPPSHLIEMIEGSPNLRRLELFLSGSSWGWQPSSFFHQIKNPLQELIHLALGGYLDEEWYRLISGTLHTPGSFHSFLGQHSRLRVLHIFAVHKPQPDFVLHPEVAERLFPSLVEFFGPSEMCIGIVTSRLATQLEILFVIPTEDDEDNITIHPFERLSTVTRTLSQLSELGFLDSGHPIFRSWSFNTENLQKLFYVTPQLKRLDLGSSNTRLVDLLAPLHCVPGLTELSIPDPEPISLEDLMLFKYEITLLLNAHSRLGSITFQSKANVSKTLYLRRLFNEPNYVTTYCMY
ncbi:unnamed protein product [Rhizoctonia solani]|uniref:F-box domain-containing protein n=1 Tax=Rhizoctonia solani TaxID=456999 RepID=A0A8H3CZW5_9AGAM|nr:unnamed protein product [Rhizoctonia solani]